MHGAGVLRALEPERPLALARGPCRTSDRRPASSRRPLDPSDRCTHQPIAFAGRRLWAEAAPSRRTLPGLPQTSSGIPVHRSTSPARPDCGATSRSRLLAASADGILRGDFRTFGHASIMCSKRPSTGCGWLCHNLGVYTIRSHRLRQNTSDCGTWAIDTQQ